MPERRTAATRFASPATQRPQLCNVEDMPTRMADLVHQSVDLADRLVRPLGRRWVHVQAVARSAENLASAVPSDDRPILVAAAWLHDIGYAPELGETGFHPLDGAHYLRERDFPDRVVNLVAHHSGARYEAAERGLTGELAEFELEDSAVMDALVTVDLTTGPDGESLRYRDRVAEILRRYPSTDPVHRAWLKAADPLEVCVVRTQDRISGYPIKGPGLPSR